MSVVLNKVIRYKKETTISNYYQHQIRIAIQKEQLNYHDCYIFIRDRYHNYPSQLLQFAKLLYQDWPSIKLAYLIIEILMDQKEYTTAYNIWFPRLAQLYRRNLPHEIPYKYYILEVDLLILRQYYTDALEKLTALQKIHPKQTDTFLHFARLYDQLNISEKCVGYYIKYLEVHPKHYESISRSLAHLFHLSSCQIYYCHFLLPFAKYTSVLNDHDKINLAYLYYRLSQGDKALQTLELVKDKNECQSHYHCKKLMIMLHNGILSSQQLRDNLEVWSKMIDDDYFLIYCDMLMEYHIYSDSILQRLKKLYYLTNDYCASIKIVDNIFKMSCSLHNPQQTYQLMMPLMDGSIQDRDIDYYRSALLRMIHPNQLSIQIEAQKQSFNINRPYKDEILILIQLLIKNQQVDVAREYLFEYRSILDNDQLIHKLNEEICARIRDMYNIEGHLYMR